MHKDLKEVVSVPNKRIKRLVELGLHVEREQMLKAARRRMTRMSRRRNQGR